MPSPLWGEGKGEGEIAIENSKFKIFLRRTFLIC